jgi:pimeloyl-ACP methyl ester carboxylesterase
MTPAKAGWRRRTVSRDGVDLAVFEGGDDAGPTLVLVHGWPDTHHVWDGVADLLAPDHHLVSYDTRGQGESVTDAGDRAFTVDELASDFFAVVDAVSPDRPVHVLGHDWGSIQVWEAVCRPGAEDRVASFTSMSGPHLDHLRWWVSRRIRRPTPRGTVELLAQAVSSAYVPFLVSPLAPPVLRMLGTPDMVSGLRYYRANLDPRGARLRESRTRVPVLQLVLTRDVAVRRAPLTESDRWTEHLERVELPYGHGIVSAHPDVVADEAARFVRSVELLRRSPRRV